MAFKPLEQVIDEFNKMEKGIFSLPNFEEDFLTNINPTDHVNQSLTLQTPQKDEWQSTADPLDKIEPNTLLKNQTAAFSQQPIEKNSADFNSTPKEEPDKVKRKNNVFNIASSLLFYAVIIGAVMMAFVSANKTGNGPRDIMGYSYFTVLSPSMQDEIPKGSLVITKKATANELAVGDNITFMKSANTTVTHKIIKIYENYDGKGSTGYQTKGVNNDQADRDIVNSTNIVGKVVFSVPKLGAMLEIFADNLLWVMGFLGLLLLASFFLQIFFKIRKEEKMQAQQNNEETLNNSANSKKGESKGKKKRNSIWHKAA